MPPFSLADLDLKDMPVPGSSFDVLNNSGTMKTAGQIPPPPPMPMQRPMPPPMAAATPAMVNPAPSPMAQPPQPPPAMPGMNDILNEARGAGAQLYGNYTPERRNDLYMALLQRQNSMPQGIGSALSAVGDAIAHGYGRDQTNFLDKTLQGQKETTKEGLDAFDTTQKANLGMTAAGLDFQKMDPNSAISKVSREAYAPLLSKLGYSPMALAKMSGANVESVAKVAADYGGKEMENLFRQAQLIVQNSMQRQELAEKERGRQMDALKIKAEHPIMGLLPTDANKALNAQAGLGGGGAAPQAMFAKNSQGHRIMSTDGGKSWVDAK